MKTNEVAVQAKITPKVFREFAFFDTMYLQKRYRAPAGFAAILAVFACVCFSQLGRLRQAGLMGGILLVVGLGLPAAYFLAFFLSVRT